MAKEQNDKAAAPRQVPCAGQKIAALTSRKPVLRYGLRHTTLSVTLEKTSPDNILREVFAIFALSREQKPHFADDCLSRGG